MVPFGDARGPGGRVAGGAHRIVFAGGHQGRCPYRVELVGGVGPVEADRLDRLPHATPVGTDERRPHDGGGFGIGAAQILAQQRVGEQSGHRPGTGQAVQQADERD
ncbi:hypothetical protein Asi02nite_63700 [Asanoa siamensis]|uniref:Uncharacterized protein n=1 Tax=Asanoa siamensis TaxID=926357 RepID=A0ABQ4D172_9ACTN|nr:hypothetical protein Asi02nite_63700 [Asanoa siamensis]